MESDNDDVKEPNQQKILIDNKKMINKPKVLKKTQTTQVKNTNAKEILKKANVQKKPPVVDSSDSDDIIDSDN